LLRFANPEYFYLYWLVPALIVFFVWAFRHKKRLLKRLGDEELMGRLTASVRRSKQIWKGVLIIIVFGGRPANRHQTGRSETRRD
jgi:Ca-activated chloride channel family protein